MAAHDGDDVAPQIRLGVAAAWVIAFVLAFGELGADLAALQRELRVTAIYVTHDREDAAALADRLVHMQGGSHRRCGHRKRERDTGVRVAVAVVAVLLVGRSHASAQEPACRLLYGPEFHVEPTVTFGNLFQRPRIASADEMTTP